jgi:hypothetical protein
MRIFLLLVLLTACAGSNADDVTETQDLASNESAQLAGCNTDPSFMARFADGRTTITQRVNRVASGVHISSESRFFDETPPLAVAFGDYQLRVLEDLTVCVDVAPAP